MDRPAPVCAACGSHERHPGTVTAMRGPAVFIPVVRSWLSYAPTLHTEAMACTTCRLVGQYLDANDLQNLRRKEAADPPEPVIEGQR